MRTQKETDLEAEVERLTFVEKNHLQGIAMLEARIAELEAGKQASAKKQWDAACEVYQEHVAELESDIDHIKQESPEAFQWLVAINAHIAELESRLRDRQNALDHAIDYGHRMDERIAELEAASHSALVNIQPWTSNCDYRAEPNLREAVNFDLREAVNFLLAALQEGRPDE